MTGKQRCCFPVYFCFLAFLPLLPYNRRSQNREKEFGGSIISTEPKNKVANPCPLGLLGFGMTTVLLAISDFTGSHAIHTIAAIEGIFCGLSAIYSAMGQIVNGEFGKKIIPLG